MAQLTANTIRSLLKTPVKPTVGIVCGSGLKAIASFVQDAQRVQMEDLPGYPLPKVPGHESGFVFGTLGGVSVVVMQVGLEIKLGKGVFVCVTCSILLWGGADKKKKTFFVCLL